MTAAAARVEVRARKRKVVLFLLASLAFGAAGIAEIATEWPGKWWAWASVLFFGVFGTIIFARQLRATRAPLAFDATGIEGQGLPRRLAWDEVEEVVATSVWTRGGRQRFIGIVPKDPGAVEGQWGPIRRLLADVNDRMVGAPLNIPTNLLEGSQDDILAEIRRVTGGRVPVRDE